MTDWTAGYVGDIGYMGAVSAVLADSNIGKTKKRTDKINAYLINRARGSADISYLASPVTGGCLQHRGKNW